MTNARSLVRATLALALCTIAGPVAAEPTYTLRARGAYTQKLITFLSRSGGRGVVIGSEVSGTVDVDAEGDSLAELQSEVARASGAGSLVLGDILLIGSPSRIAAAQRHPLRRRLDARPYASRPTTLDFDYFRVTSLLRVLALEMKQRFEVEDGFEARLTIYARDRPWTEVLDAIVVAGDLNKVEGRRAIRISRRGYGKPHFIPLDRAGSRGEVGLVFSPRESRCPGPLGRFDLRELKLVASITGLPEPTALVQDAHGSQYALRRGDCIGAAGGVATRIERDGVVVQEVELRDDGTRITAEHVLALEGE
jgi:Tfp pilus assembly protein PilP